jgi:hypothetical protein
MPSTSLGRSASSRLLRSGPMQRSATVFTSTFRKGLNDDLGAGCRRCAKADVVTLGCLLQRCASVLRWVLSGVVFRYLIHIGMGCRAEGPLTPGQQVNSNMCFRAWHNAAAVIVDVSDGGSLTELLTRCSTHPAYFAGGTYLYSYEHDTLLLSDHTLALLGHPPAPSLDGVSLKEVHRLCGEAFSAPCVASVLGALALNPCAPWWLPDPDQPSEL